MRGFRGGIRAFEAVRGTRTRRAGQLGAVRGSRAHLGAGLCAALFPCPRLAHRAGLCAAPAGGVVCEAVRGTHSQRPAGRSVPEPAHPRAWISEQASEAWRRRRRIAPIRRYCATAAASHRGDAYNGICAHQRLSQRLCAARMRVAGQRLCAAVCSRHPPGSPLGAVRGTRSAHGCARRCARRSRDACSG